MCIRDSRIWNAKRAVHASGCAAQSWLYRNGKPAETHLYSCLLYTSDAADERSSVDLGGRRIIKKKKPLTTQQPIRTITKERTSPNVGGGVNQQHI